MFGCHKIMQYFMYVRTCLETCSVVQWLGRWNCDREIASSTPGRSIAGQPRSTQHFIPHGQVNRLPACGPGLGRGAFTCVGQQVTPCDSIGQVTSSSSVAGVPLKAIRTFKILIGRLLQLFDAVRQTDTVVDPGGSYDTVKAALRTFLMPDSFTQDGVVFAFISYFVSATPVRLQVWRPAGGSSTNKPLLQLVCQWRVEVTGDQVSRRTVVCTHHTIHFLCNSSRHR